jgi:cobyrinic acid a,c-diamide synthase
MKEKISNPRILFSALRGSSGKTIVSLGTIIALRNKGIDILPFKKGPDYIDAAWLSKAAANTCRHLDLYLMGENGVKNAYCTNILPEYISVIEGNRGLYDGVDIYGTYSTAKIAILLEIPVILIIDCTKITNTATSLVLGCQVYDSTTPIHGIILNNVAGKRHGDVITQSIEHNTSLPVLGQIPNIDITLPERHLGLTTVSEINDFEEKLIFLGETVEKYINIDKLLDIAKSAPQLFIERKPSKVNAKRSENSKIRLGIIKDSAFQFYYPENLEALENEGAIIIEFDSMKDDEVKNIDLLYIAGGFPEVHAEKISNNKRFRGSIKRLAEKGLPIYGECGAVIYLGEKVYYQNKIFEMCGVFPMDFKLQKKPAGHGYTEVEVDKDNPFFEKGMIIRGHEFHYSVPINWNNEKINTSLKVKKGYGFDGQRDGIYKNNVFATYTHVHASGTENWAKCLLKSVKK